MQDSKKTKDQLLEELRAMRVQLDAVRAGTATRSETTRSEEILGLFTSLIRNMRSGILVETEDRTVFIVNKAFCEIFSIPAEPDTLVGRDCSNIANDVKMLLAEPHVFPDRIHEIVAAQQSVLGEEILFADGRTCERDYLPIFSDDRKFIGHMWQYRDLTKRKRAEKIQAAVYKISEATSSSENLDKLFHSIHSIVGELMPVQNFYISLYDANSGTLSFPYFVDEFDPRPAPKKLGAGLTEYVLRTGAPLLASPEVFERLAARGDVESIGAPSIDWLGVPLKQGSETTGILVVQTYTEGVRFGEEEKNILMFVSTQIAMAIQRKRTDDLLRQKEERYRAFVERSSEGIWCFEIEHPVPATLPVDEQIDLFYRYGYLGECNDTMAQMYGYTSAGEITGARLGDLLMRSDPQNIAYLTAFIQSGYRLSDAESRELDRSGTMKYFLNNLVGIVSNGMLVRAWGTQRDITGLKELEEQLRQAHKMESIGTLAGGISHDFNNILNIILGYASHIEEHHNDPAQLARGVQAINKAVQRGAGLVRQLLTFARKTDVMLGSVDLNETIRELAAMLHETFPRTISVTLNPAERLPSINADHNQLHQALLNLCLNARDAMPSGGTLSLSTDIVPGEHVRKQHRDALDDSYVRVRIADTGAGMDAETREHIFEPFFTTKEIGKGMGLGLSVVYGIVKGHRGFVQVESEPGKGTTFCLCFPVSPFGLIPTPVHDLSTAETPGGTATIMLVEDEEMLLDLVKLILEGKGYEVLTASDGIEAVEIYKRHWKKIGLVLSDMGLPRLGGWEAFLQMKEINPGVKVILASGYLDQQLRSRIFDAGAKDFVQKPYEPGDILQRIHNALQEKS